MLNANKAPNILDIKVSDIKIATKATPVMCIKWSVGLIKTLSVNCCVNIGITIAIDKITPILGEIEFNRVAFRYSQFSQEFISYYPIFYFV